MRLRQGDISSKPVNGGGLLLPERTPTLFTLTPGKDEHLTIAPLHSGGMSAQDHHHAADMNGHGSERRNPFVSGTVPDLTFDEARVLICTTFVGEASQDMVFYNQWLQHTPALSSQITMEGMFLGPPTMLLVSMPLAVWNVVQHDKVCCFLGYINSHNMIDLYKDLINSTPTPRTPTTPAIISAQQRGVEDGRVLLEAARTASSSPAIKRRHEAIAQQASSYSERTIRQELPARNPLPNSAPLTGSLPPTPSMRDNSESAEMKEAAEQLKALKHIRNISDGALSVGAAPETRKDESPSSNDPNESVGDRPKSVAPARKPLAKAQPKFDTRCTLCSHAPFKDSSSLRKHIAAAHTRPFPCAFSFAGCSSTFGSKNEWKRHISSQHLCLQYYRCSQCPSSAAEGKGNEFNRKDLFTQHLRRMHAPFAIKKALTKDDSKLHAEWENHVKEMQVSCLVTRREPPQHVACPKTDCQKEFEGHIAWDEWTEHVGRHMEKGDGPTIGVDSLLAQWALDEGIIESQENGEYRFASAEDANGVSLRRESLANGSFVPDTPKLPEDSKADDEKVDEKVEDKVEDSSPEDSTTLETEKVRVAAEGDDPDSIVVATSTAMHNRMEKDT